MVSHYGMSERVGPVFHEQRVEHPFLGQRLATEAGLSDETAHEIEQEARRILSEAVDSAKRLVQEKRAALERLIAALLEHETLEMPELERFLGTSAAAA
jgi:cell division protease FtsH